MVKALRGERFLMWQEEQQRPRNIPSRAPDLAFVSRYKCTGCGKVFFYKYGDPETPQYKSRGTKVYKDGFGKADPYCHRCWHKRGYSTVLSSSGCWICDIKSSLEGSANGHIRDTGSLQKAPPLVGQQTVAPEPVATKRKRRMNARRTFLSN